MFSDCSSELRILGCPLDALTLRLLFDPNRKDADSAAHAARAAR
jgi:hypothetical protein